MSDAEPAATSDAVSDAEPAATSDAVSDPAPLSRAAESRRAPRAKAPKAGQASGTPASRASARRPATVKPKLAAASAPAVTVACPYCALLLQPPPESSRRCSRCHQRIIVKRLDGRPVYLTEAAVLVFAAERWRIASSRRWNPERQRWLKLAAAAGAPAQRTAHLAAAQVSEEIVEASRTLYMTTVERSVRAARRDRRWEDASRIRREQATTLFRLAGSPSTPPESIVRLVREGAIAELRGIGEIAKDAELVSADCCDVCRTDDGLISRIAVELRVQRLPHAGCPKGLCRCRWDLAAGDRIALRRYQRHHTRTNAHAGPTGAVLTI